MYLIWLSLSDKWNGKLNILFDNFLQYRQNKRKIIVNNDFKDFLSICSNKRGEVEAKLISAKKLDNSEIDKIKIELSKNFGKNIKLNFKHDESIIGGLVIQVGSIMIDSSIKNKLQKIQSKMVEA